MRFSRSSRCAPEGESSIACQDRLKMENASIRELAVGPETQASPQQPQPSSPHRMKPQNPRMKDAPTNSTTEIKHRLVVPIQTRGNIGKSTEAIARCEWMTQRGVNWAGSDLDRFNRTLSTTYPGSVLYIDPGEEPESAVISVLRRVTHSDVTVIDPSAHLDRAILEALRKVHFAEIAREAQARLTVLIFPLDEVSDMDDIAQTVDVLGSAADWIVVRNPARIRGTKFFDGSELEASLGGLGAAFLEIPPLLSDTRNHLRALEIRHGRAFSPAEALKNRELEIDLLHRMILEECLKEMFRRFDAIAHHLLPTAAANAISTTPIAEDRKARKRGA